MADYSQIPEPDVVANMRVTHVVLETDQEQDTYAASKGEIVFSKESKKAIVGDENRTPGGDIIGANALKIGGNPLDISGVFEGQSIILDGNGAFVAVTIKSSDQIDTLMQNHVLITNPHNTTYNSLIGTKPPNDATHNSTDNYLLDLSNSTGLLNIEKISGFDDALSLKITAPETASEGALAVFGSSPNTIVIGPQIKTTIGQTPSNSDLVSEFAIVEYIQNNIVSSNSNVYRKDNVISVADYESSPPSTNEGDRYLLSKADGTFSSGSIHIDWGSVLPGDIVYRDQGMWKKDSNESPTEGWTTYLEDENLFAYIVFNGEIGKWAFGTIGKAVDENSTDINKNKLVSNYQMNQLMAHMDSDHSGVITFIVNKSFVEGILTGEITSHTHPESGVALQSEIITNFESGSSVQLNSSTMPIIGIIETYYEAEEVV